MKTLSASFSLFALLLIASLGTGCALQGATTATEEEESTSTAATTNGDDGSQSGRRGGASDVAQPMAPAGRDLGQCTSCGPGPQPWQNSLHVTSEAR